MIVFPAIDLKNGQVVRLAEGDMERATVYGDDPAAQARAFAEAGAEHLHVVDLDGAFAGESRNREAVEAIVAAFPGYVQLGGGIRAPGNPIALLPALGFVLFVAVAAVAARWAEGRFGEQGIALLLLIMGSMDVDAAIVTAGGLPGSAITSELAALALGGTILANMAVKLGVTLAYARKAGSGAALALGASMIALTGSLLIGWMRL